MKLFIALIKILKQKNFNEIKKVYMKMDLKIQHLYSISASSKIGGKLGWINENSVNKKI